MTGAIGFPDIPPQINTCPSQCVFFPSFHPPSLEVPSSPEYTPPSWVRSLSSPTFILSVHPRRMLRAPTLFPHLEAKNLPPAVHNNAMPLTRGSMLLQTTGIERLHFKCLEARSWDGGLVRWGFIHSQFSSILVRDISLGDWLAGDARGFACDRHVGLSSSVFSGLTRRRRLAS